MVIGIGTTNIPKVEACKAVFLRKSKELCLPDDYQFLLLKVPSDIPEMPLNQQEMMVGAKNRAINLYSVLHDQNLSTLYTVGLEGGLFKNELADQKYSYFLQSWVYVYNGNRGSWGSSGAIEVPTKISKSILNNGKELAEIIDEYSDTDNVRSKMGAVGIFTNGTVLRQDFFENALEFALAPFYNAKIYEKK